MPDSPAARFRGAVRRERPSQGLGGTGGKGMGAARAALAGGAALLASCLLTALVAAPGCARNREGGARLAAGRDDDAVAPIRPGRPGQAPFWNANAKQFIWPPAFEFNPVPGATRYRFTAVADSGQTFSFTAAEPSAPLSPVWSKLPVGTVRLTVEGVGRDGAVVGVAGTREFHRAAPFRGPYGRPVLPYAESARVALDGLVHEPFVQAWRTTGRPDPQYRLYRYAAKLIGGVMSGAAMYASQTPRPADADEVLLGGRRAAEFLMGISGPPGTPLEYFPPTYHNNAPQDGEDEARTMMISGAEAAAGYLDLYDATGDRAFLAAALRIADTYVKCQRRDGTWPLKVDNRTGEPAADIDLIPSVVISFLDRLVTQDGGDAGQGNAGAGVAAARLGGYASARDRAVRWVRENPARTFNWQAQFDDAKLRGPYQNLSKHEACEFAGYLFQHARDPRGSAKGGGGDGRVGEGRVGDGGGGEGGGGDGGDGDRGGGPADVALAQEILRFAEDQFVVWEQPPAVRPRFENLAPRHWITPCSTEQYAMFEPISGSSAFMIVAYVRAARATGDRTYLAKAESLANALTVAQQRHGGRYPTRMVDEDLLYWLNSTVNTARAMNFLAEATAPPPRPPPHPPPTAAKERPFPLR